MTNSTRARMTGGLSDELVRQFELERLNYGRKAINLYKRSIRKLSETLNFCSEAPVVTGPARVGYL
jgi:hypothetical protein